MPTATVNGTELFYEVDGEGAPCLVLHGGLGVDHTMYRHTLGPNVVPAGDPQAHRIARRIPGARVEMLDHSGHFPWLDEPDVFFPRAVDWLVEV